ncbi:MAG TPA: hypothetical protein DEB46_12050 [Myxococcales bacterium]|nr:hypothetical protein [Myxococcales bacterium]
MSYVKALLLELLERDRLSGDAHSTAIHRPKQQLALIDRDRDELLAASSALLFADLDRTCIVSQSADQGSKRLGTFEGAADRTMATDQSGGNGWGDRWIHGRVEGDCHGKIRQLKNSGHMPTGRLDLQFCLGLDEAVIIVGDKPQHHGGE